MQVLLVKSLVPQGFCRVLLIVARRSNCSSLCAADWLLLSLLALRMSPAR
jgi:hypothetical protein